ncbi:hypothetical protein [Nonomuraea sp. JJY05]|uniref:hypothetical protein n=1 Tax=Nonomuraea sp. JJY05 TaxID=3350255 RepID=UPI00373E69A2
MLNRAQLRELAQDLHIVIATGEYTQHGAITLLAAMSDVNYALAERILDQESPMGQGNVYTILPNGSYRPEYGTARVVWDYTEGDRKGQDYLPTLIERHGAEAAIRSLAAAQ